MEAKEKVTKSRGKSNVSRIADDLQCRTDRDWDCQQTLGYNQIVGLIIICGFDVPNIICLSYYRMNYYYYLLCAREVCKLGFTLS